MAGETVVTMFGDSQILKQHIYEASATPKHRLGTKLVMGDGRVFYYAKAGDTALDDGKLCQSAAPNANHKNITVAAAAAVGDTKVKVTLGASALTANYYADGYLHCNDETPEGTIYKIKSHPAASASSSVWITLYDPIWKAFTTTSDVTLTKHPYDSLIVAPTSLTAPVVGVPIIDVPANHYFWLQTFGPCSVLTEGTIVIGQNVGASTTTSGAVSAIGAYTTAVVGWTMQVNATTEYSLIFLKIAA